MSEQKMNSVAWDEVLVRPRRFYWLYSRILHTQHMPYSLCGFFLCCSSHVGIGIQGEACGEVAQHTGQGFDIHTVL